LILGLVLSALAGAAPPPDAEEIVRRSLVNTQSDWRQSPKYDFMERDVLDKGNTKSYRVLMIEGSTYNELTAVNGKPLPPAEARQQERKLREEISRRQHETPERRRRRVAEYEKERRQDEALLEAMTKAFQFRLNGEETVAGRRCFVLTGDPKPAYQPTSRETRVLKGMRGKLWVDEQKFQWVKVEAEVFRPVAFGLFIARVEPGTEFVLEQRPVNDSLWLPSHFSMKVKARVLRVLAHNTNDDETYWNYQPSSQEHAADRTARY
jgi:hypothetical protein